MPLASDLARDPADPADLSAPGEAAAHDSAAPHCPLCRVMADVLPDFQRSDLSFHRPPAPPQPRSDRSACLPSPSLRVLLSAPMWAPPSA